MVNAVLIESFGNFLSKKNVHPEPDENGQPLVLKNPTTPSPEKDWHDDNAVKVFPVGGKTPDHLNGVAFTNPASGDNPPHKSINDIGPMNTPKKIAAGVMIVEPNKNVWVAEPSNHFAYQRTFPKGKMDAGEDMQKAAVREAREETGLHVQLTGVLGDYERSSSKCRMYIGKRVGGSPQHMGWESQGMHLVPMHQLEDYMHNPVDKQIARDLVAKHSKS